VSNKAIRDAEGNFVVSLNDKSLSIWQCQTKLLEIRRATLWRLWMTKLPASRYFKPGPGFLNHLAQARGPGTKSQGTIVYRAGTHVPALSVALVQFALEDFAWTVGQRQGGYLAQSIQLSRRTQGWGSWITGPAPRTSGR
jgi:hypothetical protein